VLASSSQPQKASSKAGSKSRVKLMYLFERVLASSSQPQTLAGVVHLFGQALYLLPAGVELCYYLSVRSSLIQGLSHQ
jgi:hypothetical protein